MDRTSLGLNAVALSSATASAASLNQVLTGMNELSKRLGDLRNDKAEASSGAWARTYMRHGSVETLSRIDVNIFGVEAGYDHLLPVDLPGRMYLGIMGGWLWSGDINMEQSYSNNGIGHGDAPSIGAYATWLSNNGWFLDATVRHFWSSLDLTSYQYDGNPVNYSMKTRSLGTSLEAGKIFNFGEQEQWFLEPRLEVASVWTNSDSLTTSAGNEITYSSNQSLQGTAGLNMGYKGETFEPYLKLAVTHEFEGDTDVDFDGTTLTSKLGGTRGQVGLGLNANITEDVALYMDGNWDSGSHMHSVGGNLGIRYTW